MDLFKTLGDACRPSKYIKKEGCWFEVKTLYDFELDENFMTKMVYKDIFIKIEDVNLIRRLDSTIV